MYLDICVDTVGTSSSTSSSSSMYRHFRHSTCCANTCNRPVNLCSDLLPCPNPYPLYNLVMVRLPLPLPSPSPPLTHALVVRFVRKIEKKVDCETKTSRNWRRVSLFLPPKTRVSGNWKMFISRCSTFEENLDRRVLHIWYTMQMV